MAIDTIVNEEVTTTFNRSNRFYDQMYNVIVDLVQSTNFDHYTQSNSEKTLSMQFDRTSRKGTIVDSATVTSPYNKNKQHATQSYNTDIKKIAKLFYSQGADKITILFRENSSGEQESAFIDLSKGIIKTNDPYLAEELRISKEISPHIKLQKGSTTLVDNKNIITKLFLRPIEAGYKKITSILPRAISYEQ